MTSYFLKKLLGTRKGISAVIVTILFVLGIINPDIRDQIASVLNVPASSDGPLTSKNKSPLKEGHWNVVRVVDGDTIIVGDSADKQAQYQVRLIGADTPETVKPNTPIEPFGPEASAFTKRKIADAGNQVRLAFDGDQVDRYGRSLAMVYLTIPAEAPMGEELWLNELLLREGFARALLQYRFSKGAKEVFRQAEAEAKAAKRGVWGL